MGGFMGAVQLYSGQGLQPGAEVFQQCPLPGGVLPEGLGSGSGGRAEAKEGGGCFRAAAQIVFLPAAVD